MIGCRVDHHSDAHLYMRWVWARGGGRLDAGMAVEERVTYCRICEPLCGMVATVEDGRLKQLRPDRDHPLSQGYACPKGIAMEGVQNDPDRVLYPLRRTGGPGEFERVTWEEAMGDIAARLRRILGERGP